MRGTWVKLAVVSAVLVLSVQVFRNRSSTSPWPDLLSPEEFRLISPVSYRLLLDQPDICRARTPFLVLLVPVAPREAAARQAVRDTWGSSGEDTVTLFFTGIPAQDDPERGPLQELLEEESRRYGDLVQMDFLDSYQNLTIKSLMMMSWLAIHCPNASYAMKVDADIFLNVFLLLERLRTSPRTRFITGSVIWDGRPRRDPSSKWFLSEQQYPEETFPPYVSGAGYVFSTDLASEISRASRSVRPIPLEDVYIGLCLRVLGVRPVYSRSLPTFRNLFEVRDLKYDRCVFSRLVLVNRFRPAELLKAWQDFTPSRTEGGC